MEATNNITPEKIPQSSVLTKKRYEEVVALFARICDGERLELEECKSEFERIMCFDPKKKLYNAERGKQIMASQRRRAAELGVTVYEYKIGRWKKPEAAPERV